MNTEQQRALALAKSRRRQAEAGPSAGSTPEQKTVFSDFGTAFKANVDPILEGIGTTLQVTGADRAGQFLKDATEMPEGYQNSGATFMNEGGEGYNWEALPGAIGEQFGQFAGSIAARAIGVGVGAAAGSIVPGAGTAGGAIVGGFAGPALFEGMQILGPVAMERAKNNGRSEPNAEDFAGAFATASASGALNSLAPGASGILKRMLIEGGTEGAQGFVQQAGETAGTDAGLELDAKSAIGEGIIGMGSAGAVDGTIAGVQKGAGVVTEAASGIRHDSDFSEDQQRAAQRLIDAADGDESILANVGTTSPNEGAQGAAKAALQGVRAEVGEVVKGLKALAKRRGDDEAMEAISALTSTVGEMNSRIPTNFTDRVKASFEGEPDVDRLVSLANQANSLQEFTKGQGDMGGFSKLTRYADITDGRNSMKWALPGVGIGAAAGPGGMMTAATALAGGLAINRAARGLDILTNNRSKVKRFVDSAKREGDLPAELTGQSSQQTLRDLKQSEQAKKAAKRFNIDQAKEKAKAKKVNTRAEKGMANAQKKARAQNAVEASHKMNSQATEKMFATGVIPGKDPYFEGYRLWNQATGMNPEDTLAVLEKLAADGKIPEDIPQRYREDIYSFKGDNDAATIQRLVRDLANPDHEPDFSDPEPSTKSSALDKWNASNSNIKPTGNRRKYKAQRGERAGLKLDAVIEDARDSLKPDQYVELLQLREAIDSPGATRADRQEMVDEALGRIFKTQTQRNIWRVNFAPLASVGNDYAIEREEQSPEAEVEEQAEAEFEKKVKAANKKTAPKESKQLEMDLSPKKPLTRAERGLQKLSEGPKAKVEDVKSPAEKNDEASKPALDQSKATKGKRGLVHMLQSRVQRFLDAETLADIEGEILADYVSRLPKHTEGRIETLIYEFASDRLTMNMLVDAYADRFDIPYADAGRIVNDGLAKMEAKGQLARFKPKGSSALKADGEFKKSSDGTPLEVIQLQFKDPEMVHRVEIAKALNLKAKQVSQGGPNVQYSPTQLSDGIQSAFKNQHGQVDGSFEPILNFLNDLRNSRLAVGERMIAQIEEAILKTEGSRNAGRISDELRPSTVAVNNRGRKVKTHDDSPLQAVAQLLFEIGGQGERADNRIFQEWMAGDNLRVYSKNGSASSQGGDLMKGILRAPEKAPLGDSASVDFLLHGFGNLLGYDKESPLVRRQSLFKDKGAVDALVKFASNPFGRNTTKQMEHILDNGEGFFQVLNVAHEVSSMVEWVRARHPDKSGMSGSELLQDADVLADLAMYETDFMVQLDASNNAYQIAGLTTGDQKILQATGMQPPSDTSTPADARKGADIYMEPALSIAERVPELQALGLPSMKLRKLFKGPIGTYLYAAAFESRRKSFKGTLGDFAKGTNIFGINGDGLVEIPDQIVQNLNSEDGHTFTRLSFDAQGDVKKSTPVRRKVVSSGGSFKLATADGSSKDFTTGAEKFETKEDAIREAFSRDFYGRLNRELVRDMETRFPGVRTYLNYSNVVATIMKGRSSDTVAVPTVDGMVLEYSFKNKTQYEAVPVDLGAGNVVQLGVKTPDFKLAGRGLAAFMTHQNDAYVLREAHKRLQESGGLVGFNPIHDSFGFHPSDAQRGQETVVEVMQELGNPEYNIFVMILEANGISMREFVEAGGVLPDRQAVTPVPASEIPTAVS